MGQAKKALSKIAGGKEFVTDYEGYDEYLHFYVNDPRFDTECVMEYAVLNIENGVWIYTSSEEGWEYKPQYAPCPTCDRVTGFRGVSAGTYQCKTCGQHARGSELKVTPVMASQTDQEILRNAAKLEKYLARQGASEEFRTAATKTRASARQ